MQNRRITRSNSLNDKDTKTVKVSKSQKFAELSPEIESKVAKRVKASSRDMEKEKKLDIMNIELSTIAESLKKLDAIEKKLDTITTKVSVCKNELKNMKSKFKSMENKHD